MAIRMDARTPLEPWTLASLLDRWALRREKVLEKLDLRAAAKARELARACYEFAAWRERADVTELEAHLVWLELRERVAAMLTEANAPVRSASAVSGVRPAAGDAWIEHDRGAVARGT